MKQRAPKLFPKEFTLFSTECGKFKPEGTFKYSGGWWEKHFKESVSFIRRIKLSHEP